MSIDDLQKPIEIDVLSDVGFKDFQFMKLGTDPVTSYADMKTLITSEVTGKETFDKNPAHLIVQVHFYDCAPKITLEQANGKWTVNYNVSADLPFIYTMQEYINS